MKPLNAVALAIFLLAADAAQADPAPYDGAGRVVSGRPTAKPTQSRPVQAPQPKPRALLLPAVQKAAPAEPKPPAKPAKVLRDPPMPVGKALLVVRKPKDTDPAQARQPKKVTSGRTSTQGPYQ